MNLQQLMFLKLSEESDEVGQECSKIMQFGMDEVYAPVGVSNRDRLRRELQDLFAIVQILNEDFGLDFVPSPEAVEVKRAKILHYANYSHSLGLLTIGDDEMATLDSLSKKVAASHENT